MRFFYKHISILHAALGCQEPGIPKVDGAADLRQRIDDGMDHIAAEDRNVSGTQGLAASGFDLEFRRPRKATPEYVILATAVHADNRGHTAVAGQRHLVRRPDHVEDQEVRG